MLDAIRQCVTASTVVAASKPDSYKTLSYKDAFKLATLGGSEGETANYRQSIRKPIGHYNHAIVHGLNFNDKKDPTRKVG